MGIAREPEQGDIDIKLTVLDVINALPFYTLLINEDHEILLANNAVRAYLGVSPGDLVGQFCPKVIHGLDGPFDGCPLEDAVTKGEIVEKELLDKESGFWFKSAIYPIDGVLINGKRVFFHMVTDITARKKAEEQLRLSHMELRSLLANVQSVREEERKRIARDLHDETLQLIASTIALMESALITLSSQPEKAKALIRRAQNLCVNVVDELQRLIHELRPLLLDDLGLIAAIESLIQNNLESLGIKVSFEIVGKKKRLPSELEVTLYRIIQEAVNNIAKHADAGNVIIRVLFMKEHIEVLIKDNGKGFNVEKAMDFTTGLHSFGLLNMKERIYEVRGVFNIQSNCDKGETTINIKIPYLCS